MESIYLTDKNKELQSENSFEVLVDSEAFKQRLELLIPQAKKSVYIQTMTFEGDSAGEWLIELLVNSKADDIRLCIDSYSKLVINDNFIYSPKYFSDKHFRKEVINTKRILKLAKSKGIKVTFTNPLGFLFLKYPFRNHKKIVVIDEEISFIGGINFSDHNFEWHDIMISLKDISISKLLAKDIRHTCELKNQNTEYKTGNSELHFLDGYKSRKKYDQIFSTLNRAKKSIKVFSPYLSDPLLSYLKNKVPSHIELIVMTPEQNNKSLFKSILANEFLKGYFSLRFYKGKMSHLKAILVDDHTLIAGSSNFDFVSYYFEQEVILITQEVTLVKDFINKVVLPDFENSYEPSKDGFKNSFISSAVYVVVLRLCSILASIRSFYQSIFQTGRD